MAILTRRRIAATFALLLLAGCSGGDVPTAPSIPAGSKPAPIPEPTGEPVKVRGKTTAPPNAS